MRMKPMPLSPSSNAPRARTVAAALCMLLAPAAPLRAAPDPVLVPALPMLVPVEPPDLARDLAPLRGAGTLPPPAPAPEPEPDTAAAPAEAAESADGDTAAAEGSMRSIPEEFRPVMVETLAETAGAAAAAEIGTALGTMDLEALRIIARMSPEQIDALTLLILSQSPEGAGPPGGAPPAATGTEARWVGDWAEGAGAAEDAPAGPWSVRETRDGRILILHSEDPLSRLEVETGLVLGHFGRVTRISRGTTHVEVETASGTVLRGPREGAPVVAAPLPPAPVASRVEEARLAARPPRSRPDRPAPAAPVAAAAVAAAPETAPVSPPAAPEPEPATATRPSAPATAEGVAIQAATFSIPANARAAAAALAEAGLPAVVDGPVAGGLHRVLVGPVPRGETAAALTTLAKTGYGDAFVLTVPTILTR